MTYLLILLVIAAVMAASTINALVHDGRGPARPPGPTSRTRSSPRRLPATDTTTRRLLSALTRCTSHVAGLGRCLE